MRNTGYIPLLALALVAVACNISPQVVPTATSPPATLAATPPPPTATTTPTALPPTSTPTPPTATPTPATPTGLIAYSGPTDQGDWAVWLTNADGSGQRILSPAEVGWGHAAWSPDGQTLAFDFCSEDGTGVRFYHPSDDSVQTLNAATLPNLYGCEPQYLGVWSPDSRYITLDRGTGFDRVIVIVDVVADEVVASFEGLAYAGMAFSPDGSQLAVGLHELLDWIKLCDPTVTVFYWATGQRQAVVEGETDKDSYIVLAWLPDGRLLYEQREWSEGESTISVWTITPGTGAEPQPATDIPLQHDRDAVMARIPEELRTPRFTYSFSPDGTWFAFDTEESAIYAMSWETGELFGPIANGGHPAWRPEP